MELEFAAWLIGGTGLYAVSYLIGRWVSKGMFAPEKEPEENQGNFFEKNP